MIDYEYFRHRLMCLVHMSPDFPTILLVWPLSFDEIYLLSSPHAEISMKCERVWSKNSIGLCAKQALV